MKLIENWRQSWRFYTMWAMAFLLCMPTLFNLAVEYQLLEGTELPPVFAYSVRLVAFGTMALRVIKQQLEDMKPAESDGDAPST